MREPLELQLIIQIVFLQSKSVIWKKMPAGLEDHQVIMTISKNP